MSSSVKPRPKFHIIEGADDFSNIYEEFKEDYLNPNYTVKTIKEKYDLTDNQYRQLKNDVAEETGVNRKPSNTNFERLWVHETRFIDVLKSTHKFRVSKVIHGNYHHFGVYDNLKTAIYVRDTLEENNWSKEVYKQLRYELFGEEIKDKTVIEEIYDDFKVDFMDGKSIKSLMKKYEISLHHYKTLSRMIRKEEGIKRKPIRSPV